MKGGNKSGRGREIWGGGANEPSKNVEWGKLLWGDWGAGKRGLRRGALEGGEKKVGQGETGRRGWPGGRFTGCCRRTGIKNKLGG